MSENSQLQAMPAEALRELLERNMNEVTADNDEYNSLVQLMHAEAAIFADTMLAKNAANDFFYTLQFTTAHSTDYTQENTPGWIIREGANYGGQNMVHETRVRGEESRYYLAIGIISTGKLVQVTMADHAHGGHWLLRPDPKPTDLVMRKVVDSPGGKERIYEEWIDDLQAASRKYMIRPFVTEKVKTPRSSSSPPRRIPRRRYR